MEVTSEIYDETDFGSVVITSGSKFPLIDCAICDIQNVFLDVISKFRFNLPTEQDKVGAQQLEHDEDGDAILPRKKTECIEIGECHVSTSVIY